MAVVMFFNLFLKPFHWLIVCNQRVKIRCFKMLFSPFQINTFLLETYKTHSTDSLGRVSKNFLHQIHTRNFVSVKLQITTSVGSQVGRGCLGFTIANLKPSEHVDVLWHEWFTFELGQESSFWQGLLEKRENICVEARGWRMEVYEAVYLTAEKLVKRIVCI